MALFQTENLAVEILERGVACCWIDVKDRSYNVFSQGVLADVSAALDHVAAATGIRALVFLGRKETGFMAGADLYEFTKVKTAQDAMVLCRTGQLLMDKVAAVRVPTVALIHGPCLGGGLEFALACDYRVALDLPGTRLGLPELKLGLLPAWGGTQRLPRVVGLERALRIILQLHEVSPSESLQWGLVDAVRPTQADALSFLQREFVNTMVSGGKRPKDRCRLRSFRQFLLESNPLGRALVYRATEKVLRQRVWDDMPAPFEALAAIRTGLAHGMVAGLQREREAIGRLATTTACRNLITLFFLIERSKKAEDGTTADTVDGRRLGVVGAGTMGAGIAQLAAIKGLSVVVQEVNEAALAAGVSKIEDLFQKAVERRVLTQDEARRKLDAIGKTTTWEGFDNVDLVVEAAIEDLDKKRAIFRKLEECTRPDTVLATNTSSLQVRQLQEGLRHPERVAGMHFFNPVHKMPLVEVVRAPNSDPAAVEVVRKLAAELGKTPVIVGDSPGFVVNRILMPYLGEAILLAAQRYPIEKIDRTMRRFGMPMGPFELLDQVGLDVAAHIARTMHAAFGHRLGGSSAAGDIIHTFDQFCQQGWLGQKSGKGFYLHGGKKATLHTAALALLPRAQDQQISNSPVPHSESALQEARDRLVLLMVNEAAACLDEGLGDRADVIDLAMVFGTGWAPHRGGPLRYADDRGIADVVDSLHALARKYGSQFEPCNELRRRLETRELFYSTLPAPQLV